MGAAQLPTNVRTPTAKTLNSRTPLYALDKSTLEIALVPPRAKKEAYCNNREVVVNSGRERLCAARKRNNTSNSRKSGTLVARDCVMASSVYRWCRVSTAEARLEMRFFVMRK